MFIINYDNVIEVLLFKFPALKEELMLNDHLCDLPHCIFEIIVIPYVKQLCENNDAEVLKQIGEFLEQMALSSDKKVNEVLNVSFLEPIVLGDRGILPLFRNYLGNKASQELMYWENRYSCF